MSKCESRLIATFLIYRNHKVLNKCCLILAKSSFYSVTKMKAKKKNELKMMIIVRYF